MQTVLKQIHPSFIFILGKQRIHIQILKAAIERIQSFFHTIIHIANDFIHTRTLLTLKITRKNRNNDQRVCLNFFNSSIKLLQESISSFFIKKFTAIIGAHQYNRRYPTAFSQIPIIKILNLCAIFCMF